MRSISSPGTTPTWMVAQAAAQSPINAAPRPSRRRASSSPPALLAEQPHAGIPGRVVAVTQPAPVGDPRQGQPHRHAQRPGQMRRRRVHRHHQVQRLHHRCRVHEGLPDSSSSPPRSTHRETLPVAPSCSPARPSLETDQRDAFKPCQRLETGQRSGAVPGPSRAVDCLARRCPCGTAVLRQTGRQATTRCGSTLHIGRLSAGTVASVVPKIAGRLNSGACTSKSEHVYLLRPQSDRRRDSRTTAAPTAADNEARRGRHAALTTAA